MNIKIITCHDVYNHGASLQVFAMQHFLHDAGHDVSVIDYKPPYLSGHYSLTKIDNPVFDRPGIRQLYILAKLPGRLLNLKRKKAFDRFRDDCLTLTERYDSAESLNANPPSADLFIAGSDQIWNTLFPNGHDPAFYLDFVKQGLKASFAASFATDKLYNVSPELISSQLKSFDAVSVRERSGLEILLSLGISEAVHVCDPAFLLSAETWSHYASLAEPLNLPEKYILLYSFDNSPLLCDICTGLGKNYGLPLVSVSPYRPPLKVIDFRNSGPLDFLSLVRNADKVVTDSYHGIVFSLIFEKEFYVVRRKENLNSRLSDILDTAGLSDRIVSDCNRLPSKKIDYSEVRPKLNAFIRTSVEYLERITGNLSRK